MLAMLAFALASTTAPTGLLGRWVTSNNSIIETFRCGHSQVCARVLKIGPPNQPHQDVNNPDPSKRSQTICGLTIAHGFEPSGNDTAKSGSIYDPENGKTYTAQMELKGDVLKLRGYIGLPIIGRTEEWRRTSESPLACKD